MAPASGPVGRTARVRPVRQLHPLPVGVVDPLARYLDDPRPAPPGRPWVMLNMIASIDGATAVDGRSGELGGAGDRAVFRAVRGCCDWVLVASGTANAERYRRPGLDDDVRAARATRGRTDDPRLAIVTARGSVDPGLPALSDPAEGRPPALVITGRDGDLTALDGADVETERLDSAEPEPAAVVAALGRRGARVVLAEGGPRFNGLLHEAGILDEVCLSLAPSLVGGGSTRIVDGATAIVVGFHLDRVLEDDGFLFLRYVREERVGEERARKGHPTSEPGTSST